MIKSIYVNICFYTGIWFLKRIFPCGAIRLDSEGNIVEAVIFSDNEDILNKYINRFNFKSDWKR